MNFINNNKPIFTKLWYCCLMLFLASGLMAQPANLCSTVVNTGSNHTIALTGTSATMNGGPLASGSHIVVGYMDGSTFNCINYVEWNQASTSIAAYGTETGPKNGFDLGEDFAFRVELADGTIMDDIAVTYAPAGGFLTHEGNFANNGISQITSLAITTTVTPTGPAICGDVIVTSGSQTVIIPSAPQIEGASLPNGAYIIIGYEDNAGNFICVNYLEWAGTATSIAAYEDDATTGAKDGFKTGDELVYQIQLADGTMITDLVASYDPVGGLITAQGTFDGSNNISRIKSLSTVVIPDPMPSICGEPVNTGSSQTVAIPAAPQINGGDLQIGSFIIIGYEDNAGVFHCVNYVQWDGNPTSIAAYIDEAGGAKEGFEIGDDLVYQIELPNGTILENVIASYEDPNSTIATATGTLLAKDALSIIKSLEDFDPVDCATEKPVITLVANVSPTCAGGNNGSLTVSVSSTHALKSAQWVGGPVGDTYGGLTAGTYQYTAIDIHDCTTTQSFTIAPTAPITISVANIVHEECVGFGSIELAVNGGKAPYTYSGDLTAATTSNLGAGTYAVKATDADGCMTATISVVVENRCGCIDNDKDGVCAEDDCDDNDQSVTHGPGGACDDGDPCTTNDVYAANCNCAGTPDTDAPILVGVPENVTVECDAIPAAPSVTSVGGYVVSFSEQRLGADCDFVLSRTWTVTDNCGNTNSVEQLVVVSDKTAPTLVGVPADITVNVNLGESLPVANVTATDNCDPNPQIIFATPTIIVDPCSNQITYSRSWLAVDRCTNESASMSQMITIIDDNFFEDADGDGVCDLEDKCEGYDDNADADGDGIPDGCEQCDGSLTITLSESYDATCYDGNDGKLVINVSGGDGPYTILWSNNVTTRFNDGLVAGDYTVNVKDANNCSTSASYTLDEPAAIAVTGVITDQNCSAGTGAIAISVTGGTAPYTYDWGFGVTSKDRTGLDAGTYRVVVKDANGCSSGSTTFAVERDCGCDNVNTGGSIGFGTACEDETSLCGVSNTTLIENCALPTGGTGNLQYVWLKATTQPINPPSSLNNDPTWMIVPLSNTANLTVNDLGETTWYIRCARRAGCDDTLVNQILLRLA